MKKTAYLYLLLIAFAFVACGGKNAKFIGTWELKQVVRSSGEKLSFKNGKSTYTFKADNTFEQTRGSGFRIGKWEVDKDMKQLTLKIEKGEEAGSSSSVDIVTLNATDFIFKQKDAKGKDETYSLKKRK